MEFRDIITAGILHEISEKTKKRLKTAGKVGAGAAALGGAAYLAHKHLKDGGEGNSELWKQSTSKRFAGPHSGHTGALPKLSDSQPSGSQEIKPGNPIMQFFKK